MPTERLLVATAKPRLLASVRRQAHPGTIGQLIATSGVWDAMKARGIKSTGHNVVVYWDEPGKHLMGSPGGIPVDIGAEVLEPFTGDAELNFTTTPAGRFITALHRGHYRSLGETYDAILAYRRRENLQLAGPYWEYYGHHGDDEDQLETYVCFALA
jgi:effector-binding domain-containing protein